ncbi:hypothetical protein LOC67_24775 [Stieleria sp. JC731]|uniref:hypothetical protein n=1 Tax=Stieleria sp. JC731 TaxID=2894195 RepID=UPI001E4D8B7B|nr:hypothetical protein [Stieleria sp. JC731]MCC9603778.1 hypothetical protein [Stieleria sp. JC731]
MNFKLKDLFILTCAAAVLLAGLTADFWAAWLGATLCAAFSVSQLIALIVGRFKIRAGAVGFLVPATIYLAFTLFISNNEYSFDGGLLPHTKLVQKGLHSEFSTMDYKNMSSTETKAFTTHAARSRLVFVHLLTACVFGYIGLRFATEIYRQSTGHTCITANHAMHAEPRSRGF